MAYQTYTTTALVCGTFNQNTADCSYLLFTREAGVVYASARSVREERSRQRYALQDFAYIKVSLVKGKGGWRVGSVESLQNFYHEAADKAARGQVVRLFRLVRRFVGGEEAHTELFDYVHQALALVATETVSQPAILAFEVRLLAFLGYVDAQVLPGNIMTAAPAETAENVTSEQQAPLEALYTKAVQVSHL